MIHLRQYTPADAQRWDDFVARSVNGTFLLQRGYMDYHADRYSDHSLIAEREDHAAWTALLPGCERTDGDGRKVYASHAGLTYGGWLLPPDAGTNVMMELFAALCSYLRAGGFSTLIYKQIPTIYHRIPAQEDEYALWRLGARMEVCNIATTIDLRADIAAQPTIETRRKRGAKKAVARGYALREATDLAEFWPIVERNLRERYDTTPVHTLSEIQLLQSRFPQQIRCVVAEHPATTASGGSTTTVEAGILYFEAGPVVHIQYPHATPQGKEDGAMDLLYLSLMQQYARKPEFRYFDFGTSNEEAGRLLNETLVAQKEGFGGRGVAYRIFQLNL